MDTWARRGAASEGARVAAFFDLDKTILATASSVALRSTLIDSGLMTRRAAALGLLVHLPYLIRGADDAGMDRIRKVMGELAKGWDAAVLESTVKDALESAIDPVCYTEALDQIALHRAAGHAVVIASASVEEMVRPIAQMLGADFAIGSVAATDAEGTFTGEVTHFNRSEDKASACADLAAEQGWNLEECYAYSDSATDLPLLRLVGHPVAVNPDRELRTAADANGWQVLTFSHTVRVRSGARRAVIPAALVTLGAAGALAALWAWRRR